MRRAALPGGLAVLLLVNAAAPVSASSARHLSGGGTATISQVALNVTIEGSAASGTFNCLMAGRSAWVLPPFRLSHLIKGEGHPATAAGTGRNLPFLRPRFPVLGGKTKK